MDTIITKSSSYIDLNIPATEELSPYDAAYPMKFFANRLKNKLRQAETAVEEIYYTVLTESPILAQMEQATEKGFRYVVDASESTLKAIDSGKIKLTTEKTGQIFSQIRDANGHYGSKLPIKREDFAKGINPVQMANSLQLKALQQQMQIIADQIYMIDYSVQEVLKGQQNDRIGLYYSGMALFLESRRITDVEMKKALTAQALRSLSDATFQLTLTMQSDIKYLANREYNNAKGKKRELLIDERMNSINQSFGFIHQATMLKAGAYCDIDELSAMSTVLEEYGHFIEGTIAENASLLAQCDELDNGTEKGIWKSRAKLKLDVADFTKQIDTSEKVLYLGISKEAE
jgi:hypothetical protein